MTSLAFLIAFLSAVSVGSPKTRNCVLPVADGQSEAPSHPNHEGVISRISANELGLTGQAQRSGEPRLKTFLLTKDTQVFTVFGGYVAREELLVGQVVRVWLEDCGRAKGNGKARVAVLQLASQRPGEEFP